MDYRRQLLPVLEALRNGLADHPLSAERVEELSQLLDRIEKQWPDAAGSAVQPDLLGEMQREVTRLEPEHPDFAATIRELINMLRRLEI